MRFPGQTALLGIAISCACITSIASARTLVVGADRELTSPSAAAAVAVDGDVITIDPGEYFDCAVWRANRLIIEGGAEDVVVTDKTCEAKALFIVRGDDITIRNL